jgi:RND family efflux transporter MFP subunit
MEKLLFKSLKTRPFWLLTWGTTVILILLALVLIVLAVNKKPTPLQTLPKDLANVAVRTVSASEHWEELVLPARLEAEQEALISPELAGRLQSWRVAEGDVVAPGQIVAEINSDEARARLAELDSERRSALDAREVASRRHASAEVVLKQVKQDLPTRQLDLDSAQATLELALKEHERITTLKVSNISSQADLDTSVNRLAQARIALGKMREALQKAQLSVEAAQAQVAETAASVRLSQVQVSTAERRLDSQRITLAKSTIKAPFAGRLEEHLAEAGEVVSPGMPLARLYALEQLRAVVDVPDRQVAFLDTGNAAMDQYVAQTMPGAKREVNCQIIIPGLPKLTGGNYAGLELEAKLVRIALASDPASNTFKVELQLPNPGLALKQGMIVRARIRYLRYPQAIVIPLPAIQVTDAGTRVLVVERHDSNDVAHTRDINPISIMEDRVLVADSLRPGERLIVSGGKGVMNGEEVKVIMSDGIVVSQPVRTEQAVP